MKRRMKYNKRTENSSTGFLARLGEIFERVIGNPFKRVDNNKNLCYNRYVNSVNMNVVRPTKNTQGMLQTMAETQTGFNEITKIHKVIRANKTTIEKLPATITIGENQAVHSPCLAVCNVLRDFPRVVDWLLDTFGGMVEHTEELWIKTTHTEKSDGVEVDNVEFETHRPIISSDYNHVVAMYSHDENTLKYIKYELEKYMKKVKDLEICVINSGSVDERKRVLQRAIGTVMHRDNIEDMDAFKMAIMSVAQSFSLSSEEVDEILKEINENK